MQHTHQPVALNTHLGIRPSGIPTCLIHSKLSLPWCSLPCSFHASSARSATLATQVACLLSSGTTLGRLPVRRCNATEPDSKATQLFSVRVGLRNLSLSMEAATLMTCASVAPDSEFHHFSLQEVIAVTLGTVRLPGLGRFTHRIS